MGAINCSGEVGVDEIVVDEVENSLMSRSSLSRMSSNGVCRGKVVLVIVPKAEGGKN